MNTTETTKKPSNRRANKAAREPQPQAASPDESQADARQPAEPKMARSRTRTKKQRPPAKKDRLVELLRRENGATIEELMAEFGWQAHTVRGAISIAAKRLGVTAAVRLIRLDCSGEAARLDAGRPPRFHGGRPARLISAGHIFAASTDLEQAQGATQPRYGSAGVTAAAGVVRAAVRLGDAEQGGTYCPAVGGARPVWVFNSPALSRHAISPRPLPARRKGLMPGSGPPPVTRRP